MAVAFDAVSTLQRANGGGDPMSWTHTPVGTPRGVLVGISHSDNGTGVVSSVSYGGVAMTKVVGPTASSTESMSAEMWFLGSSIPTGAQTVSIDLSLNGTNHFLGTCMTVTASKDTEVVAFDSLTSTAANPSLTLPVGGRTSIALAAIGSGLNTPPTTPLSGITQVGSYDPGNQTHSSARQTTAGTSDVTIGWTAASDDFGIVAASISEAATVVSGSFTANANIKATIAGTFTADAHIKGTVAQTFTADAYVKRLGISGSFTADAQIGAAGLTTYVNDNFDARAPLADSLGAAPTGGDYTGDGTATDIQIDGSNNGWAEVTHAAAASTVARLLSSTAAQDVESIFDIWTDKVPTGAEVQIRLFLRMQDTANYYRIGVYPQTNGNVVLEAHPFIASVAGTNFISLTHPSLTWTAGTHYRLKVQAEGTNPTTIRMKIWDTGGSEPGSWDATGTDSATALQGTGFYGFGFRTTSSVTNFPIVGAFDNWTVTSIPAGGGSTISGSFTADAHIAKNGIAGSFTADANISKTGIAGSFTADAYIQKTLSGTFTADAYIKKTTSGTFTADANIKNTIGGTFTADAYIKQTFGQTFTADAYIKQTFPGSFTADAYVKKTIASTFTADANIKSTVAGSFTADAYVKNTIGGTFTADAEISAQAPTTVNGSFTADAYIAKTTAGSFTADANIKATIPGTFTADAYVKSTLAGSFTANANIKNTLSGTFTADAYIKKTLSGTLTADAYILRTFSGSFTADANIKATVSQTFTADATIAIRVPGSFTADAYIRQTTAGSFTADAYIRNTLGGTFTADAYVKNTIPGSFTADAYVRATLPGSFTADAYILKTTAGNFTADAEISRVGRIVWTTPGNGDSITNTPTFSFVIPQATGNIFFHIELDTVNTFNGVDYRSYKSAFDQTGWEYFNGATWVAVPASGVSNSFAGNEARFSPPSLTTATWYRRIRGGV